MVRTVAERALTRQGYTVITASDGEQGLGPPRPAPTKIDLLISDVVMPVMDGPTMVREARAAHPAPADAVHVGLCRGAAAQVDRHRRGRLPAQALLGEPAAEAARDVLGAAREAASAAIATEVVPLISEDE